MNQFVGLPILPIRDMSAYIINEVPKPQQILEPNRLVSMIPDNRDQILQSMKQNLDKELQLKIPERILPILPPPNKSLPPYSQYVLKPQRPYS